MPGRRKCIPQMWLKEHFTSKCRSRENPDAKKNYQNKSQTVVFKKLNNKNYLHGFSEDFKEENEIEKENIIFNDNMCIQMISMDLLFKKIALCDLGDFDFDVIEYLSMQINCLLDNDSLINKIESLFDYYLIDSSEKSNIT